MGYIGCRVHNIRSIILHLWAHSLGSPGNLINLQLSFPPTWLTPRHDGDSSRYGFRVLGLGFRVNIRGIPGPQKYVK